MNNDRRVSRYLFAAGFECAYCADAIVAFAFAPSELRVDEPRFTTVESMSGRLVHVPTSGGRATLSCEGKLVPLCERHAFEYGDALVIDSDLFRYLKASFDKQPFERGAIPVAKVDPEVRERVRLTRKFRFDE